jgi:hypothetical protein
MRVQPGLAVLQRDVANQGEHLDLLLYRDALVLLLIPVEVPSANLAARCVSAAR